jgi:conjugative transposon TraM protein
MNKEVSTNTFGNMRGLSKEQVNQSPAFIRKRKMMLVLPLLVLPFLTMAFWALGGGKASVPKDSSNDLSLNLNLPDANLKEEELTDKLGFYEKADRDSIKKQELMRSDPYYIGQTDSAGAVKNDLEQLTQNTASKYNQHLNTSPFDITEKNPEEKIMQKIALLQKEIDQQPSQKTANQTKTDMTDQTGFANEVNRLEDMMQEANKTDSEDQEVRQLNGTLDKILDIQHPQRVKDRLKEQSLQQKVLAFTVSTQPVEESISLLDSVKRKTATTEMFYGIEKNITTEENINSIEAFVDANQVLVNGAILKLRLNTDIYINGNLLRKGNAINGVASLNDERLEIEINSIRKGNSIFPVKLDVYDLDGLRGIYIPGAITRDVARQSADNGLQLMELTSLDPSIKAQATAAGISTAKNLVSRKIKQVKVMVKSGYKVLLKNKNIEQ